MPSFFPLFAYQAILLLMVVVAVEVVPAIADCSFDDQEETVFVFEEVAFGLQACLADGRWK